MEIKIDLPLFVRMGVKKPKNYHITLNNYRNWHYQVSNNIKKAIKEVVTPQLAPYSKTIIDQCTVELIVYIGNKRLYDLDNRITLVKMALDAIVSSGILTDDTYDIVTSVTIKHGGIDKVNPHATLTIKEVE